MKKDARVFFYASMCMTSHKCMREHACRVLKLILDCLTCINCILLML